MLQQGDVSKSDTNLSKMFAAEGDPISGRVQGHREDRLVGDGERVDQLSFRHFVDEEDAVGESGDEDVRRRVEVGRGHIGFDVL